MQVAMNSVLTYREKKLAQIPLVIFEENAHFNSEKWRNWAKG